MQWSKGDQGDGSWVRDEGVIVLVVLGLGDLGRGAEQGLCRCQIRRRVEKVAGPDLATGLGQRDERQEASRALDGSPRSWEAATARKTAAVTRRATATRDTSTLSATASVSPTHRRSQTRKGGPAARPSSSGWLRPWAGACDRQGATPCDLGRASPNQQPGRGSALLAQGRHPRSATAWR